MELVVRMTLGTVRGRNVSPNFRPVWRGGGADHGFEEPKLRAVVDEVSSLDQFVFPVAQDVVDKLVEHLGRGAHHAKSLVVVPQAHGNRHGGQRAVFAVAAVAPLRRLQKFQVVAVGDILHGELR